MSSPIKPSGSLSEAAAAQIFPASGKEAGPASFPASKDEVTVSRRGVSGKRAGTKPGVARSKGEIPALPAWPKISRHYFSGEGFNAIHPDPGSPIYHNARHSENVASVMYRLASSLEPENAKFLSEVALLHDVDPQRKPGTPARVPATLEWIDANKGDLAKRFGWGDRQVGMAKALIMRTEFPFDDKTRPSSYKDFYKEKSPVQHYEEMLRRLQPDDRGLVIRSAPILSEYADKGSWYMKPFPTARRVVEGLVNEIGAVGGKADIKGLNTSGFLESIGRPESFAFDYRMAAAFMIGLQIPLRDEIFSHLSAGQQRNFYDNIGKFRELQNS